jgi:replication factor C subunit 3/5
MNSKEYLLWNEKYKPLKMDDILGQEDLLISIKKMINNGSLPHMLFYGISGTGKTSTANAIIKELYGDSKTLMVMKLDASDDRGINSVRDEIKGFAEKITIFNKGIKLIVLDEADSMTFDAQFALRRIIEKYSESTRFCLICNYENKIIPAIKSRCANFKFNPINKKFISLKLNDISKKENLKISKKSINIISDISNGDLRKSINLLQSISMRSSKITDKLCYTTAGIPSDKTISKLYNILLNKKYNLEKSLELFLKNDSGYSLSVILKRLVLHMINNINDFKNEDIARYFIELSDLEARVAKSTFGDIYITSLVSIFKKID